VAAFLKEIFNIKQVVVLHKRDLIAVTSSSIVTKQCQYKCDHILPASYFSFSNLCRGLPDYQKKLKQAGYSGTFLFADQSNPVNIVTKFVDHVLNIYNINEVNYPRNENLVLISNRKNSPRVIKNLEELEIALVDKGFDVRTVDFNQMSVKEQIIEVFQSRYFMGAAGSNMTNALFLPPGSQAVFVYPKHARLRYKSGDIITSAILLSGVQLIEYEKPYYDERDIYLGKDQGERCNIFDYSGNIVKLKPQYVRFDITDQRRQELGILYNIDFYLDPEDVVDALYNYQSFDVSLR